MTDLPLEGRVAVVTGASRGIGRATALGLAKAGAHVIAIARTVGGLEELDDEIRAAGGAATLVPLNLTDYAAIDRLGAAIFERWGRLDILVGNAAVLGVVTPLGHMTPKVFDELMAINVTANWRLIRSFDMLLRQSDAARVLFLTSDEAERCRPYWGPYAASKAALQAMARAYAAEMKATNVTVNLFDPGAIRSKLRTHGRPGEDPETVPAPETVVPEIVRLVSPGFTATGETIRFAAEAGAAADPIA